MFDSSSVHTDLSRNVPYCAIKTETVKVSYLPLLYSLLKDLSRNVPYCVIKNENVKVSYLSLLYSICMDLLRKISYGAIAGLSTFILMNQCGYIIRSTFILCSLYKSVREYTLFIPLQ